MVLWPISFNWCIFLDGPEENSSKLLSTPFVEDSQHRLKWVAYLEFTHNEQVEDLTWDKVSHIARKKKHMGILPRQAQTSLYSQRRLETWRLETWNLGFVVLFTKLKKGTDQLCSYCMATLFLLMQKAGNGSVNLNSKAWTSVIFWPGLTQTGLYSLSGKVESWNFG